MWELTHWRSALTNKLTYWWETYFLSMVKPMFDSLDVIVTAEEEISNLLCSEKRANPCSHYQGHFKPKHLRKNEVTSLPGIDCLRNWMRVCVCASVRAPHCMCKSYFGHHSLSGANRSAKDVIFCTKSLLRCASWGLGHLWHNHARPQQSTRNWQLRVWRHLFANEMSVCQPQAPITASMGA